MFCYHVQQHPNRNTVATESHMTVPPHFLSAAREIGLCFCEPDELDLLLATQHVVTTHGRVQNRDMCKLKAMMDFKPNIRTHPRSIEDTAKRLKDVHDKYERRDSLRADKLFR